MGKIETVQDFRNFLKDNRDTLREKAVEIEKLPPDDEWVNDSSWDQIYVKGVAQNGQI